MKADIFDRDHEAFGPQDSGLVDLRFGNAGFLANYWTKYDNDISVYSGNNLSYSNAFPNANLKEAIVALHEKVGNAITKEKYIVVGVGASQVVQAALYAMKRREVRLVIARVPHFPRFHHFSEIVGLDFNSDTASPHTTEIVSIPNNPDNSVVEPSIKNYIADCCYFWPQYTTVSPRNDSVMVFGMAKATGHASTRLGWALVQDKGFADDMNKFIEVQSCGVSVEAMTLARQVLLNQANLDPNFTVFKNGFDKLKNRWEKLSAALKDTQIKPLNDSGMFLWGKTDTDSSEYFKKIGILSVNGDYFGMEDRNHFRLNVGCDLDSFLKLIEILNTQKKV